MPRPPRSSSIASPNWAVAPVTTASAFSSDTTIAFPPWGGLRKPISSWFGCAAVGAQASPSMLVPPANGARAGSVDSAQIGGRRQRGDHRAVGRRPVLGHQHLIEQLPGVAGNAQRDARDRAGDVHREEAVARALQLAVLVPAVRADHIDAIADAGGVLEVGLVVGREADPGADVEREQRRAHRAARVDAHPLLLVVAVEEVGRVEHDGHRTVAGQPVAARRRIRASSRRCPRRRHRRSSPAAPPIPPAPDTPPAPVRRRARRRWFPRRPPVPVVPPCRRCRSFRPCRRCRSCLPCRRCRSFRRCRSCPRHRSCHRRRSRRRRPGRHYSPRHHRSRRCWWNHHTRCGHSQSRRPAARG